MTKDTSWANCDNCKTGNHVQWEIMPSEYNDAVWTEEQLKEHDKHYDGESKGCECECHNITTREMKEKYQIAHLCEAVHSLEESK